MLDCRAGSLLLPAHDGQRGVLRNHAPMLCKLATGIVQVKEIAGRGDVFFAIDGGFVRINENSITILAYDVITFDGMEQAEAEDIIAKARQIVVGQAYIRVQVGKVDTERAALLVKLAELSGIIANKK